VKPLLFSVLQPQLVLEMRENASSRRSEEHVHISQFIYAYIHICIYIFVQFGLVQFSSTSGAQPKTVRLKMKSRANGEFGSHFALLGLTFTLASHFRGKLGKSGQADEGNAAAMTSVTSISTPFASCQVIGRSGNWGKWPTGGESL